MIDYERRINHVIILGIGPKKGNEKVKLAAIFLGFFDRRGWSENRSVKTILIFELKTLRHTSRNADSFFARLEAVPSDHIEVGRSDSKTRTLRRLLIVEIFFHPLFSSLDSVAATEDDRVGCLPILEKSFRPKTGRRGRQGAHPLAI